MALRGVSALVVATVLLGLGEVVRPAAGALCDYWGVGVGCNYGGDALRPSHCTGLGRRYCDRSWEATECPAPCKYKACKDNQPEIMQFRKNHRAFSWEDLVLAEDFDMVSTTDTHICTACCYRDQYLSGCERGHTYGGREFCGRLDCSHDKENKYVGCHKDRPYHRPTCLECGALFPKACREELKDFLPVRKAQISQEYYPDGYDRPEEAISDRAEDHVREATSLEDALPAAPSPQPESLDSDATQERNVQQDPMDGGGEQAASSEQGQVGGTDAPGQQGDVVDMPGEQTQGAMEEAAAADVSAPVGKGAPIAGVDAPEERGRGGDSNGAGVGEGADGEESPRDPEEGSQPSGEASRAAEEEQDFANDDDYESLAYYEPVDEPAAGEEYIDFVEVTLQVDPAREASRLKQAGGLLSALLPSGILLNGTLPLVGRLAAESLQRGSALDRLQEHTGLATRGLDALQPLLIAAVANSTGILPTRIQIVDVASVNAQLIAEGTAPLEDDIWTVTLVLWADEPEQLATQLREWLAEDFITQRLQSRGLASYLSSSMSVDVLSAPVSELRTANAFQGLESVLAERRAAGLVPGLAAAAPPAPEAHRAHVPEEASQAGSRALGSALTLAVVLLGQLLF